MQRLAAEAPVISNSVHVLAYAAHSVHARVRKGRFELDAEIAIGSLARVGRERGAVDEAVVHALRHLKALSVVF